MSKEELDKYILKNMDYIYKKVIQKQRSSNFPIVRNNDCSDVIGDLYEILIQPNNLDVMQNEVHVRGRIDGILSKLLQLKNSQYIRRKTNSNTTHQHYDVDMLEHLTTGEDNFQNITDIYSSKFNLPNTNIQYNISIMECQQELLNRQKYEYATEVYQELGTPAKRRLYKLYFEEGYNSVRKLAKRLEISTYASHLMIKEMKAEITKIALNINE